VVLTDAPLKVLTAGADTAVPADIVDGLSVVAVALVQKTVRTPERPLVTDVTAAATRYEESNAYLNFDGASWQTHQADANASGGYRAYGNTAGDHVHIAFTGTWVAWISKTDTAYGIAQVTLDSEDPVEVDLYSPTNLAQQRVWHSGPLTSGAHTVLIEWTGTKNASASDTYIGLDALDVIGTLTNAN